MNRRTFLNKAAAVAAAPLLQRSVLESASNQIQHVVLVMMENRSFDHIFGWLPNANGIQAGLSYVNQTGQTQMTYPSAPDFTGCAYPDPDHSYDGGRTEYDNGKMDGFLQPSSNGMNAIGYYVEQDLPFRSAFARNFTTCDAYFPSIMGPTFPNRIFQYAAQTDRLDDSLTLCTLPTIFDSLQAAGVSHKYYFGNLPFVALWGQKYLDISFSHAQFLADCAAGTLPAVSFLDPIFTLWNNLATDDHPQSDVRNGDAFLSQMFNAVAKSRNWQNTVFIVNYDEWGGFFDHVVPPWAAAPNNVDPDIVDGKTLLGVRVPCVVASPWSMGNPQTPTINSTVFDHTSVLKLIESVWGLAPLTARDASNDIGNLLSTLNLNNPQTTVPSLPILNYVEPSSLCLTSTNPSGGPNFGDDESGAFIRMVNSGMLKGFPATKGTLSANVAPVTRDRDAGVGSGEGLVSTEDGGRVCAELYGRGARAVVLAHGGRFNKESWQVQANALKSEGFGVLAFDFRGFGCSTGPGQADFDHAPFEKDVLAAVHYMKAAGAKTISVIGGSFGGSAAGDASIKSPPGEIDRIVLLGAAPNLPAEKLKSRTLFIMARDDSNGAGPRLPGIRSQYERAPQPKELIILDGSAHAQFLLQTDQSARVMREILRFLSMP